MTTSTDSIEQRLAALTEGSRWEASERGLHGMSAAEGSKIDLEVPPGQKLIVQVGQDATEFPLYYLKFDGVTVHMPAGNIEIGESYDVTGIENTEDGLRVRVGDDSNFFYADSLEGFTFEYVDKDEVELANDRLDWKILQAHELNLRVIRELEADVEAARAQLAELPDFDVDSTSRYSIDIGCRVEIARCKRGKLTRSQPCSYSHGKFHGNRFSIIGDKLVLIDDARGIAAYPVIDMERKVAYGFVGIQAVDTSDTFERNTVNAELVTLLAPDSA